MRKVTIALPEHVFAAVAERAAETGDSMSAAIRRVVCASVNDKLHVERNVTDGAALAQAIQSYMRASPFVAGSGSGRYELRPDGETK